MTYNGYEIEFGKCDCCKETIKQIVKTLTDESFENMNCVHLVNTKDVLRKINKLNK